VISVGLEDSTHPTSCKDGPYIPLKVSTSSPSCKRKIKEFLIFLGKRQRISFLRIDELVPEHPFGNAPPGGFIKEALVFARFGAPRLPHPL
jgi:hypothetical protein